MEDQGYYKCKSSSDGQHSIKLVVNCMFFSLRVIELRFLKFFFCAKLAHPYLSPRSPILLYPVNRTFTITCSLLCHQSIEIHNLIWLANGQLLHEDRHKFFIETISFNTQRLTVFLNTKGDHFNQTIYSCKYDGKESSILVRRRTSKCWFLFLY